jgi:hypothetical protein
MGTANEQLFSQFFGAGLCPVATGDERYRWPGHPAFAARSYVRKRELDSPTGFRFFGKKLTVTDCGVGIPPPTLPACPAGEAVRWLEGGAK